MDMHVRPARIEDRERLLELWERSVRATHHFLDDSDVVALRPLVAEDLASDAVDWWVLVSATEALIGFLGFASHKFEAVFIYTDYHGQTGGKCLVANAKSPGACALAVDLNEQNEVALGFYKALWFSVLR